VQVQNWLISTSGMKSDIFFLDFSKWRPPPSSIFKIQIFDHRKGQRGSNCVILPNFMAIGKPLLRYGDFFHFSKMAAVRKSFDGL